MKYSKELIAKAKKMYSEGYDVLAIAKYLNMRYEAARYHCVPGMKEKMNKSSEKWRKKNLQRVNNYQKKTYKIVNIGKNKQKQRDTINNVLNDLRAKIDAEKAISLKRVIELINEQIH